MESNKEMAEALREIGIRVEPVLKALVPQEMGTPDRNDCIIEEMDLHEAYNRFIKYSKFRKDPFEDTKSSLKYMGEQ